jgi:ribosomal protein L11 methyltransferase
MEYTEIIIRVATDDLDIASAIATSIGDGGLFIEDYSDLCDTLPQTGWAEVIDDSLLARVDQPALIHLYLNSSQHVAECRETLESLFSTAFITHDVRIGQVEDTDWAESWKQYYVPEHIGRLVICPSWQMYEPADGEVVVNLDPGMAFGTGQHETTRLCLHLIQKYLRTGDRVLDMGCGSGILSISALMLGAASATACDRDEGAVGIACENAQLNGFKNDVYHGICTNVLQPSQQNTMPEGTYHLIAANIVSDVIMGMRDFFLESLKDRGILIVSGIIHARAREVCTQLSAGGLHLVETMQMRDWWAMVFRKA